LTRLPESLGRLTNLRLLSIEGGLRRLPFACIAIPEVRLGNYFSNYGMTFPPMDVLRKGSTAVKAFLLAHHHPLKILYLITSARRRRIRHLPAELWMLLSDDFLPL